MTALLVGTGWCTLLNLWSISSGRALRLAPEWISAVLLSVMKYCKSVISRTHSCTSPSPCLCVCLCSVAFLSIEFVPLSHSSEAHCVAIKSYWTGLSDQLTQPAVTHQSRPRVSDLTHPERRVGPPESHCCRPPGRLSASSSVYLLFTRLLVGKTSEEIKC